jgi:hypothetical protein
MPRNRFGLLLACGELSLTSTIDISSDSRPCSSFASPVYSFPSRLTAVKMSIDQAAILRKYKLSSLEPTSWEEVDHELDAGGDLDSGDASGRDGADPLGLRDRIE